MSRFTTSSTNDYILKDGKPFFYLADTAWMAFSNLPLADWSYYLAYRKLQGFNALQISILPITHDTSISEDNIDPFMSDANGNWDFFAYSEAYFDKAETMVKMAVAQDFVPVLGILWCSYVPDTRCSKNSPTASAMPVEAVTPYATYVAERFKHYDPMFFISGDTQFESDDESPYYMAALKAVKAVCPDALLTMHLTPRGDLSREFQEVIDFYMYQSGHGAGRQDMPYLLAEKFAAYPVKHPIVNSEPCYEGHGRIGEGTRFNAFDIRKATWQSLLSGAKMGVTYGAHGVWMFHRRGMDFLNKQRSFEPYDWNEALTLAGAWDVGFAKWVFEIYNFFDLEPTDKLVNEDREIKAAADSDFSKIAIYCPYSFDIEVALNLIAYDVVGIDMESHKVIQPTIYYGNRSRIGMNPFNSDMLFIATKK